MVPAIVALAVLAVAEPEPAKTPAQKLDALRAEAEKAEEAYYKAARALPDTKDGYAEADKLWKAFDKSQGDRFMAAYELAKADPTGEVAMPALEWALTAGRGLYLPVGIPAVRLATEHHAANPKVGKLAARLAWKPPHPAHDAHKPVVALLAAVAEKNPDRTARGQAKFGLAFQANWAFEAAESKQGKDVDALAAAAEAAFEAVAKEYGDCRWLYRDTGTLGDMAAGYLHELRNLRVGKVAPAIVGKDLDNKEFGTDECKGKVRVVVFWGSWCGPCMAMVPDEVKLHARLKDKPFAIIGVNSDDDRATARKVAEEKGMAWRSFWNGPDGSDGPISKAWNVRGWPTVYVIDARGVIRYKGLRHKALSDAVDVLMAELEKDTPAAK